MSINIFVISPEYLDALYTEALKFDFTLQGYGNIGLAMKGLQYTNISDIVGFLYMADNLPKDTEPLERFMTLCNAISSNLHMPFMFAIKNPAKLGKYLTLTKYDNLKFIVLKEMEEVTDLLIKRDIFGALLLERLEPYKLNESDQVTPVQPTIPVLEYKPVFSGFILSVFSHVDLSETLEDTLRSDKVYLELMKVSEIAANIRRLYITRKLGKPINSLSDNLKVSIEKVTDPGAYCNYKALFQLAVGEVM